MKRLLVQISNIDRITAKGLQNRISPILNENRVDQVAYTTIVTSPSIEPTIYINGFGSDDLSRDKLEFEIEEATSIECVVLS